MLTVIKSKYNTLPKQVKASFWFMLCSLLQKGISVISTPIFTRLLSTSEYGQYGVFNSWLNIVTVFVTMRMYYSTYSQGLVKYEDDRARFSSSMQGLLFALVLFWTIIYIVFSDFWNRAFGLTTVQMLAMLLMIWTTGVFSLWSAEQRVEYKYRALVAITLVVSLAKPIVGVVFVIYAADKVTARILGLALVEIIGYFGLFVIQTARGKKIYSKEYWMRALLLNIPLIPHYLSQTVLNSADRIMIKEMIGSSESGIYSLANSLSQIMTLFNTSLLQTLNPWVFKKLKNNDIKGIATVSYICMAFIAFLNILLIAVAPEAVAVFAPKTYYEAIIVIPPIAMSVFFVFCYGVFAEFEFYYEKTSYIMAISVIGALINIILNYVFISIYGYIAAGYTTLLCYILYCIGHYLSMLRICKGKNLENVFSAKILILISATLIACGFIFLLSYENKLLRYSLLMLMLLVFMLYKNKIITGINTLLNLRK